MSFIRQVLAYTYQDVRAFLRMFTYSLSYSTDAVVSRDLLSDVILCGKSETMHLDMLYESQQHVLLGIH